MNDDEHLREALLELELLRGREAERLRETRALLAALEALTGSTNIDAGIASLLSNAKSALDCDRVVFFENRDGVLVDVSPCVDPAARSQWSAPGLLTRPRRIVDIAEIAGLWENPPEQFLKMRSLLSVPFGDDTQRVVLAAFSEERGRFTASDSDLLARMAAVASQAILRRSLESRNEFLAAVIDKSPVSVAIADVGDELPLIYVNDAFVELTGYDRSEILGQNCRLLSAEDPDSDVRREIRRTVVDRTTGTFTLRNRKKSGEIFWNELRLFPVNDADGNVSHIVATQTDATQRMQAEMDRDAARRRLEGALTATTEAFLVLGKDGNVRFANASRGGLRPVVWASPAPRPARLLPADPPGHGRCRPANSWWAHRGMRPDLAHMHRLLVANCLAQSEALMRGRTLEEATAIMAAKGLEGAELERQARHRVFPGNRPSTTLVYPAADAGDPRPDRCALRASRLCRRGDPRHQQLRPMGRRAWQGTGHRARPGCRRREEHRGQGRLDRAARRGDPQARRLERFAFRRISDLTCVGAAAFATAHAVVDAGEGDYAQYALRGGADKAGDIAGCKGGGFLPLFRAPGLKPVQPFAASRLRLERKRR